MYFSSFTKSFKPILIPTEEFLQKKLEDNRYLSAVLCFLGALIGSGLWIMDYYVDPEGAMQVILLRLLNIPLFVINGLFFLFCNNRKVIGVVCMLNIALYEIIYTQIQNRLDPQIVIGIDAYMFFLMFGFILYHALSYRMNLP